MSMKYICVLAFISILETPIEAKVDIQNEKNLLSLRPLDNRDRINIQLPKEHRAATHFHKSHKKLAKYNPLKLPPHHHKQFPEVLPFFKGTVLDRQLKKPSKVYPVYSDYLKDNKKRQKKFSSSAVHGKSPKADIKSSKVVKKIPIRSQYSREKKVYKKESPKEHKHLSKPSKSVSKVANTPSIYLKPPEIGEKSFYNTHKRRISLKSLKKPSSSVTDYLKGEENRQEKNRHYVRDHEPMHQKTSEAAKESNNGDNSPEELSQETDDSADDGNRVDFHIHGHDGPESYVFGFDTGEGDNRQFRWEQRHVNGTVTGQYGYYDPTGKFKKIFYRSDPFLGYQQSIVNEEDDARNLIENEGK